MRDPSMSHMNSLTSSEGDVDDEDKTADSYVLAGVNSATARSCAARVVGSSKNPKGLSQTETFFEVFGRESIVQEALQCRSNLDIKGLHAMDTRPYGGMV